MSGITEDDFATRKYDLNDHIHWAKHVQETLDERQKTHGDFTDNAVIMQALKGVARDGIKWGHLSHVQREALEMILHKIGRIVTGNPNEPDHWLDIEGYARLARERIP